MVGRTLRALLVFALGLVLGWLLAVHDSSREVLIARDFCNRPLVGQVAYPFPLSHRRPW